MPFLLTSDKTLSTFGRHYINSMGVYSTYYTELFHCIIYIFTLWKLYQRVDNSVSFELFPKHTNSIRMWLTPVDATAINIVFLYAITAISQTLVHSMIIFQVSIWSNNEVETSYHYRLPRAIVRPSIFFLFLKFAELTLMMIWSEQNKNK